MSENFPELLAARLESHAPAIEQWLKETSARVRSPFTASVDLRDAGFKLAPIDTNVFPGGFNNLCSGDLELASRTFQNAINERVGEGVRTIGIVAEGHTSNLPYFSNLRSLQRILEEAGFKVEVLSFAPELVRDVTEVSVDGERLELARAIRQGDRVGSGRVIPDILILNNDLSTGLPDGLSGLGQPLFPAPELGWFRRRKSIHFEAYADLAKEVGAILRIDPWHLLPLQEVVRGVDFDSGEGIETIAAAVERVRDATREKYKAVGVTDEPYAVVKSDSGTYGMAVLAVESGEDVRNLNRKERKRMASGKGGVPVQQVLVQEGVPTRDQREGKTCEPVFYLVGGNVVGGFFRLHGGKGPRDNLNSRGAEFRQICYHKAVEGEGATNEPWRLIPQQARAYAFVAKLASLAVGVERALLAADESAVPASSIRPL